MAEQYNRLTKRDLALAKPVGDDPIRRNLDVITIPQLSDDTYTPLYDSNYGNAQHKHIYSGRSTSKLLQSAHIAVNHMYFGRMADSNHNANTLESIARSYEDDDDYNVTGIDERLREIIVDANKTREQKMVDRAKRLGKVLADRSVYVVAVNPEELVNNDDPNFFVARTVGMTALRDGFKMAIEPVVEGLSGQNGLMPENFFAIRGLYVPVSK